MSSLQESEAPLDLDSLLDTTDMAHPPPTLPSVQQLESYVPVVSGGYRDDHTAHSQSYNPSPTQSHSSTAEWVRGQQLQHAQPPPQMYHPQHYSGSDPARHASYSSDSNGAGRPHMGRPLSTLYPLQPQPGQEVRSPKREIKRRTKTGCLTCRRRRIKCDEGQPTCGNCRKSKRECLGYDPIFKTTGLHGPVAGEMLAYSPAMQSPVHQLQHALRPPVHDLHTTNGSQWHQPQTHAATTRPPADTPQSHSTYDLPLDPSLTSSVQAAAPLNQPATTQPASIPGLRSYRKRKYTTMDELYAIDGVHSSFFPRIPSSPTKVDPTDAADIISIWRSQYSVMLDSFFETQWYSQVGEYWMQTNHDTFKFFAQANRIFRARTADAASSSSLESRLIWLLAELPRAAWAARKQADAQLADLLHRLDVIEYLLNGSILPPNLVPPAPAPPPKLSARGPDPPQTPEYVSHSFWHNLGTFAAADDATPAASLGPAATAHHQTQLTNALQAMRHILSVLENRDVLYSVAVARHFAGRLERLDLDRLPQAPSPADTEHPFAKLSVALRFLADEEHSGTTAVVRAIAGLARRGIVRSRQEDD